MWEILRQRNFELLWAGQVISNLGDWLTAIALPFYVYQHTQSPLATGAVFMVQTLPPILFGSIAGVWVDRWDHRQTMLWIDAARAAIALLFVLVPLTGWIEVTYLAAFLQSTLALFFNPARNAILPFLVRKADLGTANTLTSIGSDVASLIGPALGGMIAAQIGLSGAAILDSLSFGLSATLIYQIRYQRPFKDISKNMEAHSLSAVRLFRQEWLEGLRLLKQNLVLFRLFTVMVIAMLGQGIINVLWILFVNQVLKGSSLEYGVVQVAVALGGVMGAFLNTKLSKPIPPPRLLGCSGMLVGIMLLSTFLVPLLPVILVLQVLCGVAAVGFFVTQQTLIQIVTPGAFLGRIFGFAAMVNAIVLLLGQGIGSAFGGIFGIVEMLSIAALLYFASGLYALR